MSAVIFHAIAKPYRTAVNRNGATAGKMMFRIRVRAVTPYAVAMSIRSRGIARTPSTTFTVMCGERRQDDRDDGPDAGEAEDHDAHEREDEPRHGQGEHHVVAEEAVPVGAAAHRDPDRGADHEREREPDGEVLQGGETFTQKSPDPTISHISRTTSSGERQLVRLGRRTTTGAATTR